jgi:hypothetical protein
MQQSIACHSATGWTLPWKHLWMILISNQGVTHAAVLAGLEQAKLPWPADHYGALQSGLADCDPYFAMHMVLPLLHSS